MAIYQKKMVLILFFTSAIIHSQEKLQVSVLNDSIEAFIKKRKVNKAKKVIKKLSSNDYSIDNYYVLIEKNLFFCYYLERKYDSCRIILDKTKSYKNQLSEIHLNDYFLNKAYFYKATHKLDSSATYYIKSLSYFEKDSLTNLRKKATIYSGLSNIYRLTFNKEKHLYYLKKYLSTSIKIKDSSKISAGLNNLGVFYDNKKYPKLAILNFKKALNYTKRKEVYNTILQNIGSVYLNHYYQNDSAFYYNKKALNKYTSYRTKAYIHRDLSIIAKRNNLLKKENKELHLALKNILLDPFQELELELYKALYENNKKQKNYNKSLFYYEKYNRLNDSIKKQSLIEKVEEIQTKYETEKKEKELVLQKKQTIEEQQKNKDKNNLLIGAFIFIVLVSGMGYLTLKNSRRKRLLAIQEKELETQKNLTLLKEQEITTINAMINGQEKERTRIAEDLHDNLGSVIATLKLHFDNLRINQKKKKIDQEILFDKTESLIDEAYKKVRSIAHAKNAGVIANQGLLVTVKLMAEKISSANSIQIEVIDFGLEKRLENSLEISLFRIIQELTTNIIKHAQATKATINISQHEKEINVLLEDNGIGMDISKIYLQKGMGLDSIKTRVTHLQGNFTVDSTPTKGTTIIINIPT